MSITRFKNDVYHDFLYRQLDLMLAITKQIEGVCKKFIPHHEKKIAQLYYGVKQPEFFLDRDEIQRQRQALGFGNEDFIVGLIGRLEPYKGQHLLIKAIHSAKQRGQDIKAFIVGHEMDAGYRDQLKLLAKSLGVSGNIIFQDFSRTPQTLMQLCDCVLLATEHEAFGLVLPEAMRAGIAVIGSNRGGVLEIIDHQKTGLLFESGNEDSLYQQINYFYKNSDIRKNIAAQGKIKADQMFDNDGHFQALEKFMIEVVKQ
ncbi:MAG: glycosyltransferase family 4 protein, partial [Gammaproteobacteria bacterium]|nr:glycosyltransferase family 4 protein [Gammaproteobacteria bacterium]